MVVYQNAHLISSDSATLPYFAISLSLNILLTLMIVVRLILHTRSVRNVMGRTGSGGFFKAIITMLIESCALYAVNSIVFIGLWGARNYAERLFRFTLTETQVRAFPRLRSLGRLSDVTTNRTGDRSPAGHSTSRR